MPEADGRRQCVRCGAWLARDNPAAFCSPCQSTGRQGSRTALDLPLAFWDDAELRAALERRHMGHVIRAYRTHPHHGPRGLSQDVVAAWAGITQGQLSKTETGPAINRLDRLVFWAQLLDIPEDDLWFKLPKRDRTPARPATDHEPEPGAPIAPDDVSMSQLVEAWELFDVLTRGSISLGTVTHLESAMYACARQYPAESPRTLGPTIHRQMARVAEALDGPQPLAVRRRLVRLMGYLSSLAANLYMDLHEPTSASGYFDVAAQASREIEDGDLAAWVAANRAIAYHFAGALIPSRSLLDGAASEARVSSSERRRAWVFALQARAHAATGDRYQATSLLDEAHAALAGTNDPVSGTDFFDEPRLDGIRGSTLLLLGNYAAAEQVLTAAGNRRAESEVKGRALLALDLASCRLLQGEHEHAVRLTIESLEMASGSLIQPIATRATEVTNALHAAGAVQHARPLVDRLIEIDATAPAGPS